ncbi:uncharacterized protein LOC126754401 [Bactrocera neohumeralis]|uniref:uncharacterized protein LOC126754401 n=1 Tax=Bactrocera neohumeralis TaxID=98809 RepID=UPI0021656BC6|nr:uncharacterized protein LOC126754401 [Bactrocera neohumeralis]
MENSPSNSIEKQIDNFLEHFKRSASKAMEADWCSSGSGSSNGGGVGVGGGLPLNAGADGLCNNIFGGITANGSAVNQSPINHPQPLQHPLLQRTKSRSSCLDISDLSDNDVESVLAESQAIVLSAAQQRQQQLINQHMLESQTSVSSGASIQTVLHQSMLASTTSTGSTQQQQQQQHIQRAGSISSNNTTPAHRAATPTKTQQQIAASNNSNGGINSSPATAQSVSYATEALVTLRPQTQTPQQQQLPAAECINSLLEHISPAAAAAAMSGEGVLNIADVADLLHPQHAIITGGRSHGGCPLIIFPDNNNFNLLEEADYQKLILYLTSVPSLQDTDLGFQLIIDRRKDKWTSVKTALQRISIYFPGIIHVVYVLRPSGLFQKAISEVSTKFSKDEYRFRLVVCSALTDLHEYIDKSQLTVDMGGTLIYSHHEWIQQRISLEKFSSLTHQVSTELDIFIQTIHDTEFPNSVEATQKLIDVQGGDYERLKEEILAAAKHGETLLNNIKGNEEIKEFSERTGNVSAIERASAGNASNRPPHQIIYHQQYKFKKPQHFDDCRDYRRLLVQLEETERRFDEFWRTHRNRLQQCLELRRFEQDFRELQTIFDAHLKCVAEMTEIGESVERVDTLMDDTKHYQELSRVDIERAGEVISAGQQLLGVRGVYPWEIVQPKCDELQRVCDIIAERLCKRLEILSKNRELMERVEKANQWCANGVELLASQRIEKCSASPEIAEQSLQEIQAFIASAAEFKLSSPSEFKKIFLESTTPETKALVSQHSEVHLHEFSLESRRQFAPKRKIIAIIVILKYNNNNKQQMSVIASDVCFFRRWSSSSMAMAGRAARLCNSATTGSDKNNSSNDTTANHNNNTNKCSACGNNICNNEAHEESMQESIRDDNKSNNSEATAATLPVLQRIDDVSLMCDKRIASLKKLAVKPQRPVQTVTPEPAVPLQPQGGAPHLLRRKHKKFTTAICCCHYCHKCGNISVVINVVVIAIIMLCITCGVYNSKQFNLSTHERNATPKRAATHAQRIRAPLTNRRAEGSAAEKQQSTLETPSTNNQR